MPKIIHDRANCIGCGSCSAICPDFWEMSDDGKAMLKGGKHKKDGGDIVKSELQVKDVGCNQDAASSCPVNVIKIE